MGDVVPDIAVHLLVNELLKFTITRDPSSKDLSGASETSVHLRSTPNARNSERSV
jgi:hypothetical protein